ncbi:MAG TPA: beta-ketoacyl synthase N-terminal-like domain-containing protein, partial [Nannocystaceae bacterium]|nr:beta-ketoacyl synthase N-terminal-like domain-containing protein [Nannocystaceae bacterium]
MGPVSITAYTLFDALGDDTEAVISALERGETGLGRNSFADRQTVDVATVYGAVSHLDPLPASLAAYDTRQARIAFAGVTGLVAAAQKANARWGASRVGLVVGTSTGGIAATEAAWQRWRSEGSWPAEFSLARHHAMQATVDVVRAATGARGPGWVVSTACSSSAKAFASAQRMINADIVDAVIVGGVDSLCATTLRGFAGLELTSTRACRPFAADRDGISIGEGAAFALVERRGDGPARLLSVGESCDAYHPSAPHPEGVGARAAIEAALRSAGVDAAQVGVVNAHATGTKLNDASEAIALASVFGRSPWVVATKGYTGHMLGAAGATEVVFCVVALERGWIPASHGAEPR